MNSTIKKNKRDIIKTVEHQFMEKAAQVKSHSCKLIKQLSSKLRNNYNVILISIDTLRADHLGCYGYHRKTSPNIDRISKEASLFKNAFSTSNWTVPAHASMLTGRYPSSHGLFQAPQPGKLHGGIKTLAEILSAFGYATVGFHGGGYVSSHFGFDRGFSIYQSKGRYFEDNLDDFFNWIKKRKSFRFFIFFHGLNCHAPFSPPKEFDVYSSNIKAKYNTDRIRIYTWEKPKNKEELEYIIAKYDGGVKYADYLIGKIFEKLHNLNILSKTIVIITADHGEEFMEHGQLGHSRTLYDELIHIPLIIYLPQVSSGKEIDNVVSLVDISATILDILQVPHEDNLDGKSLLPLIQDSVVNFDSLAISETGKDPNKNLGTEKSRPDFIVPEFMRSIRTKEWKLILDKNDKPIELYCLSKDRNEVENIVNSELNVKEKLYELFLSLNLKSFKDFKVDKESSEFTETLKRQLMGLGYL